MLNYISGLSHYMPYLTCTYGKKLAQLIATLSMKIFRMKRCITIYRKFAAI
jgi:hypothetical protein